MNDIYVTMVIMPGVNNMALAQYKLSENEEIVVLNCVQFDPLMSYSDAECADLLPKVDKKLRKAMLFIFPNQPFLLCANSNDLAAVRGKINKYR